MKFWPNGDKYLRVSDGEDMFSPNDSVPLAGDMIVSVDPGLGSVGAASHPSELCGVRYVLTG